MEAKQKLGHISAIYCDSANPEVWQALKKEFGERYDEQYIKDQMAECKRYNLWVEDRMLVSYPVFNSWKTNVGTYKIPIGRPIRIYNYSSNV